MASKEPVLLVVLINTSALSWYVAGIGLDGNATPLLRSETGNLDPYVGEPLDEQVNFLRHRLSGVLQRGCDRLWGRQQKACGIIFVADDRFDHAEPDLTQRVADHFVEWMTRPPVAFYLSNVSFSSESTLTLEKLAGEPTSSQHDALLIGLPALVSAMGRADAWELATKKASR